MSTGVQLINPDQTIREAAQMMVEIDAAALPVAEESARLKTRRRIPTLES